MSDHDPRLDEMVSAHLDGESTADEMSRIEGDPVLRARVAELHAAREAVRADVAPLDDAAREAMLQRVFAELDQAADGTAHTADGTAHTADGTASAAGTPTLTPVTQLAKRRRDPSRFLAAAAAVVAVVFLGGAIAMLAAESGRGGGDDAASSAGSAATEMSADAGGSTSASGGDDDHATTVAPGSDLRTAAPLDDLGSFADAGQLSDDVRVVLRDSAAEETAGASPLPTQALPAAPDAQSDSPARAFDVCAAPTGTTALYTAELANRPVFVVIVTGEAVVLDQQTCAEVLRITPQ